MQGRPPIEEPRTYTLQIRLSESEKAAIESAARQAMAGQTVPGGGVVSTWARAVLLAAAAGKNKQGKQP